MYIQTYIELLYERHKTHCIRKQNFRKENLLVFVTVLPKETSFEVIAKANVEISLIESRLKAELNSVFPLPLLRTGNDA